MATETLFAIDSSGSHLVRLERFGTAYRFAFVVRGWTYELVIA